MAKALALVDRARERTADEVASGLKRPRFRAREAYNPVPVLSREPGWLRGIIRARQQFRDDDRRAALRSAALGYEYEALSLHLQADQHETAMDAACIELARVAR